MIYPQDGPDRAAAPARAAALAVLAWGAALLGVAVLVLTDAWRGAVRWPWGASGAAFVLAGLAFARVLSRGWTLEAGPEPAPPPPRGDPRGLVAAHPLRAAFVLLGLASGAAAVAVLHATGDNLPARDYLGVGLLWAAGVALTTLGLALPAAWWRAGGLAAWLGRHRQPLLDMAALAALALLLRLWALDGLPDVLTGDEGVFGMAARWMAEGEGPHPFGTYWANGTLYLVPHALLVRLFGPSAWAMRLPTAVGGALAVPATYALGRLAFSRRVAWAAALLLAAAHLHLHLSRMGLGHGWDALFSAAAAAGLLGALARNDARLAAPAGLALGLAQYGYVGARLVDVVVLAFVGLWWARQALALLRRGERRAAAWRAALQPGVVLAALSTALVTAGPMIRWAWLRPGDYLSRLGAQGVLARETEAGAVGLAMRQAREAASALFAAPAAGFYFSAYPMLDVLWASLLVLGLAAALRRAGDRRMLLPLLGVIGALLMLGLGLDPAVNAYRASGALPFVAALSALALFGLTDALGEGAALGARSATRLAGGVLALILAVQAWAYFGHFRGACAFWDERTAAASLLASDLAATGEGAVAIALTRPVLSLGDYESVPFLSGRETFRLPGPGDPGDATSLPAGEPRPAPDAEGAEGYLFDLPVGVPAEELEAAVRAAERPVIVYALLPDRAPGMEALGAALPGGDARTIERCGRPLLLRWTAPDGGAAGP